MLVGLTGGIGSGKSSVAGLLAEHGARVIDADVVARTVVAKGTAGLAAIVDDFGAEVMDANGQLDRARLAMLVFDDPAALRRLNAIVHPLVAEQIEAMLAEGAPGEVVVYDVPLLVEESVHERHAFDLVLVVQAPAELRVERLATGRGMTEEQARARMAAQATDEQRRAVADVVIDNDRDRDDLARAVDLVWRERIDPAR